MRNIWYEACAEIKERQKEPHYSPLCNTTKDKIREYIANHFIEAAVVKTDIKSIVKAMEEGVRLGKEEQKSTESPEDIHNRGYIKGVEDAYNNVNEAKVILKKLAKENPKSVEWSEDYRGEDLRTRFAFYTYKDEYDALYLSNVFVEETSRNKGFGTKILAAAEKVAETIGAINIRLKVKQNSPANAWYRKHGYGYMAFEGDYDWLEKTLEYLKPIKSEWSEEDEALIENVCTALKGYALHERKVDLDEHAHRLEEMSERLKSLRPQPKEDLNAIAQREYARGKQDGYWEGVKAERESCKTFHYESPNWPPKMPDLPTETTTNEGVSSIQPHWKPSEVQMEALAWYSGNSGVPPTGDKAIKSLYIDLQKLL